MKEMKRILSLVLCFVMLVGMMPAFAIAAKAEEVPVDALVVMSDLHIGTNSTNSTNKQLLVQNILNRMKEDNLPVSSVASAGDMYSSNEGTMQGDASAVTDWIKAVFNVPVNYVWTDHDRAATDIAKESRLVYSGNYYVYLLSMADMSTYARYTDNLAKFYSDAEVTAHIEAFKTTVAGLDKSKPLFIVGHQPLFDNRGDNGHAYEWAVAINEVAGSMDVAYFFGHNHKFDKAEEYFYAKGSTIQVPINEEEAGSPGGYNADLKAESLKLEFTHVCAGYLDPGTTSSTTRKGTAVAVKIYADRIQYVTYNGSGEYTDSYSVNETVARSYASVIENGYVAVPGQPGADDVIVYGTNWTTLTEEVPAVPGHDGKTTYVYTLDTDGTVTDAYDEELGYLLVGASANSAMSGNGSIGSQSVTINNGAITLDEIPAYQWKITPDGKITNGTYWLRLEINGLAQATLSLTTNESYAYQWSIANSGNGNYTVTGFYNGILRNYTYYLCYSSRNFTTTTNNANNLRLFKGTQVVEEGTEGTDRIPGLYAYLKGELSYNVTNTTTAQEALALVKEGIAIQYATYADKSGETTYGDDAEGMTWTLDPAYDPAVPGDYAVTIAYNGTVLGVAEVVVPPVATYYVAEGSALYTVEEGTSTAAALAAVQAGVTVYTASDANGTGKTEVSDDSVNWEWVDTYNSGAKGPYTLNITKGGNIIASVEVQVNTENESHDPADGDSNSVTIGGTTTQNKEVYVLVNSLSAGEYLIVNPNKNQALSNNNGADSAVNVTLVSKEITANGTTYSEYIENPSSSAVWTVAGSTNNGYTFANDGEYLRARRSNDMISGTASQWTYSSTNHRLSSSGYYVTYAGNNNFNNTTSTPTAIYLYKKVTAQVSASSQVTYTMQAEDLSVILPSEGTITGQLKYALLQDGEAAANLPAGGSYRFAELSDENNIIGSISDTGVVTFTGNPGTAKVRVAYTWTQDGQTYTVYKNVTVKASAPYYSIELHEVKDGEKILIEAPVAKKGVAAGQTMNLWAVVKLHDAANPEGTDMGELGNALHWTVSNEAIATINPESGEITFTGEAFGTFQVTVEFKTPNGDIITDTVIISASESQYVVPGDGTDDFPTYPNEGAVRFDKTAQAVGNFSETGLALVELSMTGVPYTANNRMDVVLMLDRSSSMDKAVDENNKKVDRIGFTVAAAKAFVKNIVMNEDGTFNDNRIIVMDFLGGNLHSGSQHVYESNLYTLEEEKGYQVVNNQAELDALLTRIETGFTGQTGLHGTEYAKGLQDCYNALHASQTDGNKQFCVFMSDGIPNYFQGENTHFDTTSSIINTMYSVSNANSSSATVSRGTKYEYEYYSTQMKNEGVTVFTVGLGLKNTNSAWSNASKEACEQVANMLLNDISGPAGETAAQRDTGNAVSKMGTYFFSVADANAATQMGDVFGQIAQKILEAATEVVVEDKIDSDFTVNFALPENVTSDATEGLNEFYIQAVEYQLNENKERTGDPTVLENFTFNVNGTLKSHTVDGVACSNCGHVTITDGKVTKIDGTYFDYSSAAATNEEGEAITEEFLHWNAEKLTTTELALQYFAYLDHSAGEAPADQVPAGTYYTNEYATLTYTNYKGNRVQREFPIPQVTWNGAQVSYVFYLVNAQGQPVNRAGRVVPFAEAVYVTDVNTYSVVWNDMEQSAGLNANYLAHDLVPEVYALYDNNASYELHVYEDQDAVNLNNHFVIGGNVNDEYNISNGYTNANTTYVFNTKADAEKYNVVGAYVVNGVTNYLCKDYSVTNAQYEEVTENLTTYNKVTQATYTGSGNQWKPGSGDSYTGGSLINGAVYYVDENGDVYTIIVKQDGTQVRTGFDFSNTTVAFAVVWKPELAPDAVVVDYGLDVLIDVTANDAMAAGLVGVRDNAPVGVTMNKGAYSDAAKAQSVDVYIDANNDADGLKELKIGTATVESQSSIRFSLDKDNAMQFTDPAVFYYEAGVNYYKEANVLESTNMYSSVTVIPATTVYYEDSFLQFASFTSDGSGNYVKDENHQWVAKGQNGLQDQDRPGASKISEVLDADNNYGYDGAYKNMSTFSMGSAAKFTVNQNTRGEAYFTFYGTGFDVIGLTSNRTGTLLVQVTKPDGTAVMNTIVDTYYGCTPHYYEVTYTWMLDEESGEMKWIVTGEEEKPAAEIVTTAKPAEPTEGASFKVREIKWDFTPTADDNSLYQIPVIKIVDLPYGQYNVTIMAVYGDMFNHTATDGQYDLYLDAIRIYDPTGNQNSTANDAYIKDGEGYPEYFEVRNQILTKETFDNLNDSTISGIVFIDGGVIEPSIADYKSYGPNNEVYLTKGQAIAFDLNAAVTVKVGEIQKIQLAVKTIGGTGKVEVYGISKDGVRVDCLNETISTATDMYYDISELEGKTVVIRSTGDAIVSITNVKVTYTAAQPNVAAVEAAAVEEIPAPAMFSIRRLSAVAAVESMMPETEPSEPETEPSEPETEPTEPETKPSEPEKPEKPDNSELKAIVKQAKKLKEKDFTKESFKAVKEALKDAEKVLKDKKATQEDINEAVEDLNEALGNLEAKADKKPGKPDPKETAQEIVEEIMDLLNAWLSIWN